MNPGKIGKIGKMSVFLALGYSLMLASKLSVDARARSRRSGVCSRPRLPTNCSDDLAPRTRARGAVCACMTGEYMCLWVCAGCVCGCACVCLWVYHFFNFRCFVCIVEVLFPYFSWVRKTPNPKPQTPNPKPHPKTRDQSRNQGPKPGPGTRDESQIASDSVGLRQIASDSVR